MNPTEFVMQLYPECDDEFLNSGKYTYNTFKGHEEAIWKTLRFVVQRANRGILVENNVVGYYLGEDIACNMENGVFYTMWEERTNVEYNIYILKYMLDSEGYYLDWGIDGGGSPLYTEEMQQAYSTLFPQGVEVDAEIFDDIYSYMVLGPVKSLMEEGQSSLRVDRFLLDVSYTYLCGEVQEARDNKTGYIYSVNCVNEWYGDEKYLVSSTGDYEGLWQHHNHTESSNLFETYKGTGYERSAEVIEAYLGGNKDVSPEWVEHAVETYYYCKDRVGSIIFILEQVFNQNRNEGYPPTTRRFQLGEEAGLHVDLENGYYTAVRDNDTGWNLDLWTLDMITKNTNLEFNY